MVSPTKEEIEKLDQQAGESSTSENQDLEASDNSSESEKSEDDLSTLDLVKSAIENTGSEDDDTEGSSEDDESDDKDDAASEDDEESKSKDDESDDPTEEELEAWKPKTRKRFEQLQAKYRDASERLEKAEVDAGWKTNFDGFLSKNKISHEEANTLFDIGAMMKNDPMGALESLTPYYNQLLNATGQILSPELKEQVRQGYVTEQAAYELSRQRATNRNYESRDKQANDQRLQDEADQQKQTSIDIQGALAKLEQSWQTSDPDYSLKSTRVQERVKLMWFEASQKNTMPKTVDQAVRMAEKAKREVEVELRKYRPRKPVTSVDGGSNGPTKPQPQNTLDVIKQTLGQ